MKIGVLAYLERAGRVLMIHRRKRDEHAGLWLAPGGKVEPNEAPAEAAAREVREETGLVAGRMALKGVITFPDDGDSPFGDEWLVFVFHCGDFSGDLIEECPEGALEWVERDALCALPMWEGDRLFTPRVFQPGVFTAKLHYKGQRFVSQRFWD